MSSRAAVTAIMSAMMLTAWGVSPSGGQPSPPRPIVAEDFESYRDGDLPQRWRFIDKSRNVRPVTADLMTEDQYFVVKSEGGNKFLRAFTRGRAHRLFLTNDAVDGGWNLGTHPYLRWDWRATRLPKGAREDVEKLNDTGAAVYVNFSNDWLGRPKSIKYSYSSTLPVGTVVDFGRLKVLVVASGKNGIGKWSTVERNVVADYRSLFGGEPPAEPVAVMVWSDSNTVPDEAIADFDNIVVATGAK